MPLASTPYGSTEDAPILRDLLEDRLSIELSELRPFSTLWAGFGCLYRASAGSEALVVKVIDLAKTRASDRSTRRKRKSYLVEEHFYRHYSTEFPGLIPRFYGSVTTEDVLALLLEDLDPAGRGSEVSSSAEDIAAVLRWLAAFHACAFARPPQGLWEQGGYFHLATRPDEFARLPAGALRKNAHEIDRRLREAKHRTWLHGDAKPENFLVTTTTPRTVRAFDFQYVGSGPGIIDVAYFANSILPPHGTLEDSFALRDRYLCYLADLLPEPVASLVVEEWRNLYVLAWADFARFLAGWSPGRYDHEPLTVAHLKVAFAVLRAAEP